MTVRLPAWLQSGSYSAELDRSVPTGLLTPSSALGAREGVRNYNGLDFKVTATVAASMQVNVGVGTAWVSGDYTATQGTYVVINDGTVTLAIAAASSTQDRIDLVCLQIQDSVYSGSTNTAVLTVIQGTPATPGNAVPPALPLSTMMLAQVLVAKGISSVANAAITDTRPFTAGAGGILPVLNAGYRTGMSGVAAGVLVMEIDTRRVYQWDGSGWVYVLGGNAPTVSIVPASGWYNWADQKDARFGSLRGTKIGSMVHLSGAVGNTQTYAALSNMCTLPSGWAPEKIHMTSVYAGGNYKSSIRVDIQTTGQVSLNVDAVSISANTYHAIDIHFNIKNNTVG